MQAIPLPLCLVVSAKLEGSKEDECRAVTQLGTYLWLRQFILFYESK